MVGNQEDIRKSLLCQWDGDDFYVLKYFSKRSGLANSVTSLILRFKENDEAAVTTVIQMMTTEFERIEATLREERLCRYIVSIPSSTAKRSNVPCERVCRALAKKFDWLTHIADALVRIETVPKSAFAAFGKRPDYEEHVRTIKYNADTLHLNKESVIMLDDIKTRGETSRACREIITEATACKAVIGVFLGRTQ